MSDAASSRHVSRFDGGDLACGELLLRLVAHLKGLPPGAVVHVVATDPAAPIDIPFWCHLTGHRYLGAGEQPDGRPHFDVVVSRDAVSTRPGRPWHVETSYDPDPHAVVRTATLERP